MHTSTKKRIFVPLALLLLSLVMAACSGGGSDPTPTPITVADSPTSAATPQSGSPAPTLAPLPDELFLSVSAPENESVVATELVTVSGRTMLDAVVSINGEIVDVGALGDFAASVLLLEGPNIIEVVASTLSEQERAEIAVIYLP
ncbi:MAG: hypothetical protein V3S98_01400 [Dehalococcoidia bacterium]